MSPQGRGHLNRVRRTRRIGRPIHFAVVGLALVAVGACSTTTEPDFKPTSAEISVSGTSSVPLQLIVSTDFVETFDPVELVREQIFNSADTIVISDLPFARTVRLDDTASIVVDLSNPSETPATVRLVVELDGGQTPYDQEAVMSEGGSLRYVFNWSAPELPGL